MTRIIYVDDDPFAIKLFELAAKELLNLHLVAAFYNGQDAIQWLSTNEVDLIFLDVEMPVINGFQIATRLGNQKAEIVFLTAHVGFALKAFEACALDYLIKPIYSEKLKICIEKFEERRQRWNKDFNRQNLVNLQVEELVDNYINKSSYPRKIFVNMIGSIRVVNLEEVIYFDASGSYTKIYLQSGEVVLCSETIKTYADSLEKHPDFIRIHRSHIINKQFVSIILRKTNSVSVRMFNNDELPVAQQRKSEIVKSITH